MSLERRRERSVREPTSILDTDEVRNAMNTEAPFVLKEGTVVDVELHHKSSSGFPKRDINGVTLDTPVNVIVESIISPSRTEEHSGRKEWERKGPVDAVFVLDSAEKRRAREELLTRDEISPAAMQPLRDIERTLTQRFLNDKKTLLQKARLNPEDIESVTLHTRVSHMAKKNHNRKT